MRARVEGARRMLDATRERFDPTLPGLFAAEPTPGVALLMARIARDVRPRSLEGQLTVMAETDLGDLLPRIGVPSLLIWGEADARSPLAVADRFKSQIPDATLAVIPGCGHVSDLGRPDAFNAAVLEFCRAHS